MLYRSDIRYLHVFGENPPLLQKPDRDTNRQRIRLCYFTGKKTEDDLNLNARSPFVLQEFDEMILISFFGIIFLISNDSQQCSTKSTTRCFLFSQWSLCLWLSRFLVRVLSMPIESNFFLTFTFLLQLLSISQSLLLLR